MVAFDEGHRMKNMKSKTSRACLAIACTRSIVLTGSPLLNQVNELFPLLERITPSQWGSYYKFVQRYCVFGGYEGRQIVGPKNTQELQNRLSAVMIRRLKKDVLDLPEVQYINRIADLHPRQKTLYKQVVEEMRLENPGGVVVDIQNALTKFLRLKQICGTTATVADDDHSDKLDIAAEDSKLLMDSGHKVVAFTQFRGVLEAYERRMRYTMVGTQGYPVYVLHGDVPTEPDGRDASDPKKVWSRQELVHQWEQNPRPGIIIAMYQVAGIGLNMTAASHGQLLDKLFVPALNQQAVDRMHRIGASTTQPVQVYQYLCKGTVEDRVETILRTKEKIFDTVVEGSDTSWTKQLVQELMKEEA
jgi:SNF2 family DNA or RNA helicase